jgi:hypothetical protein
MSLKKVEAKDLEPGQSVVFMQESNSQNRLVPFRAHCEVVRVTDKRVILECVGPDGSKSLKYVKPQHVRVKEEGESDGDSV